jgi:hypothetical protein
MSDQTQNPNHHSAASKLIASISDDIESGEYLPDAKDELALAQAHATLALAYEQRTANLIALFGEGFAGADLHLSDVFKQIKDRLGL